MFMDQRIAWPQPEQLGPSCAQWSHIWEGFHISDPAHKDYDSNRFPSQSMWNGASKQRSDSSNSNDSRRPILAASDAQQQTNGSNSDSVTMRFKSVEEHSASEASVSNGSRSDQMALKRTSPTTTTTDQQQRTVAVVDSIGESADCNRNSQQPDNNDCTPWVRQSGYNASVPTLG